MHTESIVRNSVADCLTNALHNETEPKFILRKSEFHWNIKLPKEKSFHSHPSDLFSA